MIGVMKLEKVCRVFDQKEFSILLLLLSRLLLWVRISSGSRTLLPARSWPQAFMSFLIWEGFLLPHQCPAHQPLPTECGNAEGMAWSLFLILAFFTQLSLIRNKSSLATRQGNAFAKEEGLPLLSHALGCQLFPICLTCRALGQTYRGLA